MIKNLNYQNLMKHNRISKKNCMLCSVLVNIDQQKKVMNIFC